MFKRIISALAATLALSAIVSAENIRFAYRPSLSPDGRTIYFSYDGDIYSVPAEGGKAMAVLAMDAYESHPLVSPDGKYLAYSSNIQGNSDVYIVPVAGGQSTQLTFHEANDIPVSWSADSKYIYFESNRAGARKTSYKVSIDGGTPERVFDGFFNTIVNLVENPKTGELLFNESTESINFPTRKRYVGDHNPDIKCWNPASKEYTVLTDYIGKDTWPMVDKEGHIYYVSDEYNQESNIVEYVKGGKARQLTFFDKSVQYPSIAAGGSAIVFIKDYEINILDPATGKVCIPQIRLSAGNVPVKYSFSDEKPDLAEISPDGKKFALVIRGHLFVSDTKCKYLQILNVPTDERVDEVIWGKDSKTLYYTRTNKGWTNIFSAAADGTSPEKAVYLSDNNIKSLTPNHKNDCFAFIEGSRSVMLYDTTKGAASKIADAEFWSFQNYGINFSYDDNYIAFDAMNKFESDIYIYDIKGGTLRNLTASASVESSFTFAPDCKNAYLLANPVSSSYPNGASEFLFKLPLQKYDDPFKSDSYDKLFSESEKAPESTGKDVKKSKKTKKDEIAKDTNKVVKIDFEDIYRRMVKIGNSGSQYNLYTWSSNGKDYLFYCSRGESGAAYTLEISDPDAKPKQLKDIRYGQFTSCKDAAYCLASGAIYKIDPTSGSTTKTDVSANIEAVLSDEFRQMFYETWAVLEQNYYDVNFHGADWYGIRDYYASFLPYIRNRNHLRTLLGDMLGELNSSHLGFSSSGSEEWIMARARTYATGIEFANDNPYKVDRVLANSAADKVEIGLKAGDELIAVNGVVVDNNVNREKYFSSPLAKDELKLRFKRDGKEFDVKIHCTQYSDVKALEYREWEDQRKEMVEEATGGKIAYLHMQAMGDKDLNDFLMGMYTYAFEKDGLILDLRYNNGGNVHKQVIDFLRGQEHFTWAYRDFDKVTHPNVAPAGKPIVVLVNEHSLSDAEVTSNGIQTLGIAKLVGTETYRWIIFTSSVQLLDGSTCRMPAWGCYNIKGEDMEHVGVKPDIYVKNTFKDRLENKDPQLDAAIKEIMTQLKNK